MTLRAPQVMVAVLLLLVSVSARADFPPGFLWGTAISGFQTEAGGVPANGDPGSDWWVWVHDPTNITSDFVSGDLPENGPGFWDRYPGDLKLAQKRLRNNAFRLGIEWSRIFPSSTAGVDASGGITLPVLQQLDALADQTAVGRYRAVFDEIRARGLTPFVTLVHFTLPLWIHDPIAARDALAGTDPSAPPPSGFGPAGWLDAATVPELAKYAAYVAWKFGDQIDFWTPLNEPIVVAVSGYANIPGALAAYFPPGAFSFSGALAVILNEVAGHAAAYDAVKLWDTVDADGDADPARIGLVHNMVYFVPQRAGQAVDITAAQHADYIYNRVWLNATIHGDVDANVNGAIDSGEHHPEYVGKADFIGVNYYFRGKALGLGGPVTPVVPLFDFLPTTAFENCQPGCSDLGWETFPEGLRVVLNTAAGYGLPLYVTENGMADADDQQRRGYLVNHLRVVEEEITNGLDVRGYFHWSLVDNFEWALGLAPRFGLFGYDPVKQRRKLRRSGQIYARIIKKNTVPQQLRDRY
ncbi:MAG: glycoside hydrolase family 1 protein [Deltaproteobacteria bacterium]|nr:glycoside hydrolase family 1 protein [Deltaproteobacteria bacterium]